MTGNYKNGKEEGEWSNFWENNVLKISRHLKKGSLMVNGILIIQRMFLFVVENIKMD